MSPGRALPAGTEIAGYTITGTLGRGGTAVVYRATHLDRAEPVALKVMDPSGWGPAAQSLFERESRLAAAVAHRHILPVYEAGEHDRRPFVAMRLERCDLSAVLRQEGRLDPARAVRYVADVAAALDAAHAHALVHRDIKPSNVLLGEEDGIERAYLGDFGVARAAFSAAEPFAGDMVGTLGYVSPEQIRGESVDGRTDVYALGCLLYECLVGRLPFPRPSSLATLWAHLHEEVPAPSLLVPGLASGLDAVLARALAKDPRARYGSAGALAEAARSAVHAPAGGGSRARTASEPHGVLSRPHFLGRESELSEVDRLLRDTRLLTVTGPGGAGKTRFVLELAARIREERGEDYEHGVFTAFFASLRDSDLVLPTVARTLSVDDRAGTSVLEALAAHLRGRQLLLVCDNLEHLAKAGEELSALLDECAGLSVLCTSREVLRIEGERRFPLPPLSEQDSVALFCERADAEPSKTVAELCSRLEGLPLAVELAAARFTLLSPEELLERLSERLDLLDAGRDADPRQRTLRATIQWSYDLLSESEQQLVARLSVFADGCTLEAAETVAGADLDDLQSLLDKSLLRRDETELGPRFWMLETIREFCLEVLAISGETADVEARHDAFFDQVAAEIASEHWGSGSADDRRRFEAERANLTAVVQRAIARRDGSSSLRLVRCLGDHLHTSTGHRESLSLVRTALALPGGDRSDRAHALLHASRLAGELGSPEEHLAWSTSAEAAFAQLDDVRGLWQVVQERGTYAIIHGDPARAVREAERAVEIARRAQAQDMEMLATTVLASAVGHEQLARERPDRDALGRARGLYVTAAEWARSDPTRLERMSIIVNFAWFLELVGEYDEALATAQEALRLALRECISAERLANSVLLIACLAARVGAPRESARLAGFVQVFLERQGAGIHPDDARSLAESEALARAALGDAAYERAVSDGEQLTFDDALALSLEVRAT
jgi:non-specific serine/threonine protein kinase